MDKSDLSDTVDLTEACKVLAESRLVQTFLKEEFGSDRYSEAIKLMEDGKLDSDLGLSIHDLFLDLIVNQATIVWSGFIANENDNWPVHVMEYEGIFWVGAVEFDPVGYFLDMASAISFVRINWDNVYQNSEHP
jgi:hypothetical protein